jgi:hypothetical protein
MTEGDNPYASPGNAGSRTPISRGYWALCLVAVLLGGVGAVPSGCMLYWLAREPQPSPSSKDPDPQVPDAHRQFLRRWIGPALAVSLVHAGVFVGLLVGFALSLRRRPSAPSTVSSSCLTGVACHLASLAFLALLIMDLATLVRFVSVGLDTEIPSDGQIIGELWLVVSPFVVGILAVAGGLAAVAARMNRPATRAMFVP